MIAYRIVILPLIKKLKRAIHDITQTWYADNAGALGKFARIETYFDSLTCQDLVEGYRPDSNNTVLVVRPENIKTG